MGIVPVLLCGILKAGGGRHPPGRKRNGEIYGRYLPGPDAAGGPGLCALRRNGFRSGDMVLMACGMDYRHGSLHLLLHNRI